MLNQRFERINALAKINGAKTYLEIGVNQGSTFTRVDIPYKVAVDPKFSFNIHEYANASTKFHETTSDKFFTAFARTHKPFDIVYLDGLHTYAQTFRDFCTSLAFTHHKTIWLIDDTCPNHLAAAEPSFARSKKLKALLKLEQDKSWMGDVYKVPFLLHDFFPQFSFLTFIGHGQTVIWHQMRSNFSPKWNSLEAIADLRYDDFLEFKDTIFNFEKPQSILDAINRSLNGKTTA